MALLIVLFASERLHFTFATIPTKNKIKSGWEPCFTALMLSLYSGIVIFDTVFYFTNTPATNEVIFVCGIVILSAGIFGRRGAIKAMGSNWCVYVTAESIDYVVSRWPFSWSRHPYYWSSILELFGVSLLFQCVWGGALTFIVYFPLLVLRSCLEEQAMLHKFPAQYAAFQKKTPFLI